MIIDAHLHLKELLKLHPESEKFIVENEYSALVSCHSLDDIEFAELFKKKLFLSFGVHPQNPDSQELVLLEKLVFEKRIDAIGEIGLDRYSDKFKQNFSKQIELFDIQLDIAIKNKKPVVLHVRKAFEEIFKFCNKLSKLPCVIFHSYSGSKEEAVSLLNKGVNGFFSFGTSIINGHAKTISALQNIPFERVLLETDAPYQPVKGSKISFASDITLIQQKVSEIKMIDFQKVQFETSTNFRKTLTKIY